MSEALAHRVWYCRTIEWRAWVRRLENAVLVLAIGAAVLLPLVEALLRKCLQSGIPAASAFLQHLTLVIGMAGSAIAARDGKLLALSTLNTVLPDRWKRAAATGSGAFAAVVAGFLCSASVEFVRTEREAGTVIIDGVPTWWLQLVMPVGFGLIALRLAWQVAATRHQKLGTIVLMAVMVAVSIHPPVTPARMAPWALGATLLSTLLGAPVFAIIGGVALILFWGGEIPITAVPVTHYSLVTNPTLPAIPLFTVAGYLLAEGGASGRLVRAFGAWLSGLRGGPAIVTAVACAFFTSFTGASGVTILALGGLLLPVLKSSGYQERPALGLLTAAGSLGMLFPPCLPLLLYSIVASSNSSVGGGVSIEQMFLGGLLPGMLLVGLTILVGVRSQDPKAGAAPPVFDPCVAWPALRDAMWELLLPVVALLAMFSGWATPVEAAAVTALYAFCVEAVFHGRMREALQRAPRIMLECGTLVGGVLLILGVALAFTNCLVDAEVPARLVDWASNSIHSKLTFLLALNLFLLVVGCLMDVYSAIVVVVPLILPLGALFQVHPVHLGIVFLANLELGFLTPPVGMNLFLASSRFQRSVGEIVRAVFPLLLVQFIGVLLITYVPWLTTWLPGMISK